MGLLDSFTGSAQRRDVTQRTQQANALLEARRQEAAGQLDDYLGRSTAYLDPYISSGSGANKLLQDALGINGLDPQRAYYSGFINDPGFQAELDAGRRQVERSAAAKGNLASGNTLAALYNQGLTAQRGAFQDRLTRLSGLGSQGFQGASTAAGLTNQTGNALAGLTYGSGQQTANNLVSLGNATAASRSVLPNMLTSLGGAALKGLAGPIGSGLAGSLFGSGSAAGANAMNSGANNYTYAF